MMQLVKHISLWWLQNVWPLCSSLIVPLLRPLGLTIFSISAATVCFMLKQYTCSVVPRSLPQKEGPGTHY